MIGAVWRLWRWLWGSLDKVTPGERTFSGSANQAAKNLIRRRAVEKRLHVIARRVLDAELLAQLRHQLRISLNLALDLHQTLQLPHIKAEHGTGRNVAPFVEREWGAKLKAGGQRRRGGGELALGIGLVPSRFNRFTEPLWCWCCNSKATKSKLAATTAMAQMQLEVGASLRRFSA